MQRLKVVRPRISSAQSERQREIGHASPGLDHLVCIAAELRIAGRRNRFPTVNFRADAVAAAAVEIDAWRLVNDPQRVEEIIALGDFEQRLAALRMGYDAMVERVAAMSFVLKQHGTPEPSYPPDAEFLG